MEARRMTWPFGTLRMFGYGCIIADPPWRFSNYSAKGEAKNPVAHYDCMSLDDIAAMPVGDLAMPDCAMLMWATAPMLPEGIDLLRRWGFTFKSAAAWAKQSSTGEKWAFGTGYCFRSAAEFILLGTIGKPKVRSRSVRNLIVAPVREHSRKPEEQYEMAEALYAGPYAEVFSRGGRQGWDCFGDEVGKFGEVG
ncbi:MAG: DNA methyltransferase [Sphingomonadales bacterium]|nr:DNA methyltransferase [Sphingomonadales bacterium]